MTALRQDLFDQSPQAQLLIDADGDAIVDANHAACRLLGYEKAALLQAKVSALHAQQLPTLIVFTQAVLAKGRYRTTRLLPRHASGRELQVEYLGAAIGGTDEGHAATGHRLLLLVITDLAEREQRSVDDAAADFMGGGLTEWQRVERVFRDIERENRLILRAAGEGIYGVNAEGKTTFVNPVAERLLGWTAEELAGRDIHTVIHHARADGSHYPHDQCPIYAAFKDGAVHRVNDEVFWRKDGTPLWVEYTSTPIRDRNTIVGAVVVFRDISERKLAHEKLRAALQEVDQLRQRLELENAYLQEEIRTETHAAGIIGRSEAIQATLRQIALVAPTDASVLITGESGTGKELIARAIHEASARKDRPLIRVNCAAIPRELFESEFFGHVRGAFTGALRDRIGRFELADGGTLFLDEVGEIPPELQSKLLRILQEGQFERLGEERTRKVNVRIIAATNIDLKKAVQNRQFREDLFFRLAVFPIESLPLRDRRDDIPLLAQHFLNTERGARRTALALSQGDIQALQRYDWPGNVRELQNVMERAIILARNGRLAIDLPEADTLPHALAPQTSSTATIMQEAEMRLLERGNLLAALRRCGGKVSGQNGAAALLGIKPTTLASRIAAYKISTAEIMGGPF